MSQVKQHYNFDLIDAASFGYSAVWAERHYLLKLALVPLMIKFASMVIIMTQGFEADILKQGLILIPATLTEGWLLAQFLRTLIKQERWPIILEQEPDEKTLTYLLTRARGIVACCLVYVLLMLVTYFFKYGYDYLTEANILPNAETAGDTPPNPAFMLFGIVGLVFGIWSFRFFWIYIPFSVLVGAKDYLKYMGGFASSLKLMGLFLISMVPTLVLAMLVSGVVATPFAGDDELNKIGQFLMLFIGSAAEILIALIVTASLTWSMRDLLPRAAGALPDIKKSDEM